MDSLPRAADMMVTKLVTLAPQDHVFQGISFLLKHNITGAPVVDDDRNYLGVFSEKCCMGVLDATARRATRTTIQHQSPLARDIMTTELVTLDKEMDAFDAIGYLLRHRISGAPVIEEDGKFLGVFSEKTSMRVLLDAAYDQMPSSRVAAFMNTDFQRVIADDITLLQVARIFLKTPYRRLPVLRQGKLLGQISRRDVLRGQHHLAQYLDTGDRDDTILKADILPGEDKPKQDPPMLSADVSAFMDCDARTIGEDTDILTIADLFLKTPYRRFPVMRAGKLVGQVSRRDVLQATHESMALKSPPEKTMLYLSSLVERNRAPIQ